MRTEMADRMAEVVAGVSPLLKHAGFRKTRHTFNRTPETGLVHVVNFQMGPYEPPGAVSIPGLTENLYGLFAINFGIYVDEIGRAFEMAPRTAVVHGYNCEIRGRAGQLRMREKEYWLRLTANVELVAAETAQLMGDEVLPFLDGLPSRRALLDAWFRGELAGLMSRRSPLAMAVVLQHLGETQAARRLTADYLGSESHVPGHLDWARQRARDLGLSS